MSQTDFERFRQVVLDDPALQERLRTATDRADFIALVVGLGAQQGFVISAVDVNVAMQAGRRVWLERWIR